MILAGEELTISYAAKGDYEKGIENFKAYTMNVWGFECSCKACKEPALFDKIAQLSRSDSTMYALVNCYHYREAYMLCQSQLKLCDDLGGYNVSKERIYYDIYFLAVQCKELQQAIECAHKGLEYCKLIMGGSNVEPRDITVYKDLIDTATRWLNNPGTSPSKTR